MNRHMLIEFIVMMSKCKANQISGVTAFNKAFAKQFLKPIVGSSHTVDSARLSVNSEIVGITSTLNQFLKTYIQKFVDSDAIRWQSFRDE